jgi:TPR repeat protein
MTVLGRRLLAVSGAAAILLGASSASADIQAGIAAWDREDFVGAIREWRPLAERGDADAQFNLGQAYKLGKGVSVDQGVALSWYEKAARQGHPQAQVNVGLLLYNKGRKADSLPWLRKGADLGDARAQYILGTEMFNGQLVTKDWPRAYALMTLAAGRGLAVAGQNLKTMDEYVPEDQRRQGVALAQRMERGEEKLAGSAVRLAAADPTPVAAAPMAARPPQSVRASRPVPVQAPAAKPLAPVKAAAPAAAGGRWRVQLGAFGDSGNAQKQWATLKAKISGLGGMQPYMVKAGAVTRLQAGPFASREAAARLCDSAKAAGSACIPVAP